MTTPQTKVFLEALWQDASYGARNLRKNPAFALTAVITLALGIGGCTAMFSVVRAVLLKPLDYADPDRLVEITVGSTVTRYEYLKASAGGFSGIGAFTPQETLTLSGGAEPEVLHGARVSAGFLDILGMHPKLGRGFSAAEDSPAGPVVVMISADLWARRFNLDSHVSGKTIVLETQPYTIIGVLPAHFSFPYPGVDVWLTRPEEWPPMAAKSRRMSPFLSLFGRVKPQLDMAQANAEMTVVQRRYAIANPGMMDAKPKSPVVVRPLKDRLVANVRSMLWMLLGAVTFVLLITCANVASLMLARAAARNREFAVRAALGASRGRLAGQLLAESILLSVAGGALGVFLAAEGVRAIPLMTAFNLPRSGEVHLDWLVLAFACVLSIGTGVLFGLAPAASAVRPDLMSVLRGKGEATRQGAPRLLLKGFHTRGLLVTGQISLSVILLIGAALLMESLIRLRGENVGFNPANLLTLRISLPPVRYATEQKQSAFFEELVRRVASFPGVRNATSAMYVPMTGFAGTPVQDASKPMLRLNERPIATVLVVAPDFFRTLQIPMRRGRDFTFHDKPDAERVAIIDEAFARRFWPLYPGGQDPIGQRVFIGGANPNPARIIGIVAPVHQNLENTAWPETVYVSFAQAAQTSAMLALRTYGDPLQFVSAVRQAVQSLDQDQAISDISSMEDRLDAEVGQRQLVGGLLGSFAIVALLLALIGIYGVVSYSVTERVQELGIRSALGAQKADILRLVIGQGLWLTLAGIGVGMLGALWLTQTLKNLLFGVGAVAPATFLGIGVLFVLSALVASYLPARRAARIDPMAALRV
jgi:predicted permease